MFSQNWRNKIWARMDAPWDIIIIGGGITGAGILREATRLGLQALLIEQRDFAWGTSSRSSKLVHGGLRYLKEGHIRLMQTSVQERQRLLAQAPGLIEPLGFLIANYEGDRPGRWVFQAGLSLYDMLALQWGHKYYSAENFRMLAPRISDEGLEGGFQYGEAQTDDARLVLRIISEAMAEGGTTLNYVKAEGLIQEEGQVVGVHLHDKAYPGGRTVEARAKVVINATGAWVDKLRGEVEAPARIRPLRGSHLIFPAWRLPVAQGMGFLHPIDRRPVFIIPWEGVTLVGTTDVDHQTSLDTEPGITASEVAYLMAAIEGQYPSLGITLDDIIASYAGVRPVIGTGQADPSKESRDHIIWEEGGLLSVTGGKLTTFRLIAMEVLSHIRHHFPNLAITDEQPPALNPVEVTLPNTLDKDIQRRLIGRYGVAAADLVAAAAPGELEAIPGTHTLWAELRWAARTEGIVHLDDLLLRRVRLGLLLSQGGAFFLSHIRRICQAELGWDDARWENEEAAYLTLWRNHYSLPDRSTIPNWRAMLTKVRTEQKEEVLAPSPRQRFFTNSVLLGGLVAVGVALGYLIFIRQQDE